MADWLDGPKFVAWLEEKHGFESHLHGRYMNQTAWRWRKGEKVSIWKADELLTKLDLHISLIPEDIWVAPTERVPRRKDFSKGLREEVVARRLAGATAHELAEDIGVSERTIRKWTQKSKQKAER